MPLGLTLYPSLEASLGVLVAYRDGLERYHGDSDSLNSMARIEAAVETFKVVDHPEGSRVLLAGPSLLLLDETLSPLWQQPAPDEEPIRALLPLSGERGFLTYSDDETVRRWSWDEQGLPQLEASWPVGCLPVFARANGQSVLCLENGALCERQLEDGRKLKSWPVSPKLVCAFADPQGHSLVTIDEEGQGQLWDLHSREVLFVFNTPVRLHHGCFAPGGASGVLLSSDGDLLLFRLADGGSLKPLPGLDQPAVDVVVGPDNLILALDENGGVWSVGPSPRQLGGCWAGWATSGLALSDGRVAVGTASGELLLFPLEKATPQACQRPHQDAVLALFEVEGQLVSVAADGQVSACALDDFAHSQPRLLADFAGETVVGCALDLGGHRLWLALEEGRLSWLDPRDGSAQGDYQLSEHRIEELRPGGRPNEVLVLTDRGSLKRIQL
jgi:hypothetical protein